MRKVLSILIVVMLLYSLLPQSIYALSCAIPVTDDAMNYYDGVIIATVDEVKVDEKKRTRIVNATVNESYKGVTSQAIQFTEDYDWGSSQAGKKAIFLLKQVDDKWELPLCSNLPIGNGYEYSETIYNELQQYPLIELVADSNQVINDSQSAKVIKVIDQPGVVEIDTTKKFLTPLVWMVIGLSVCIMIIAVLLISKVNRSRRKF